MTVACAIGVVLLGVTHATASLGKIQTNLQSLATLGTLMRKETPDLGISQPVLENSCSDYVTTIRTVYTVQYQRLPSQQKLRLLEDLRVCWPPERWPLLAAWTSESQWALGQYDDVCNTLIAMKAPDKLLELAQQSAEAGNWPAVEMSLSCVTRFPADGPWVSPFIVAPLYNRIGQHYEERGDVKQAIAAYDAAARWYPVVWADPYIRKAALLWQQGAEQEVIQWLVDGVSRSTDVTATFYLWRELGNYWERQGNLEDAICAYGNALHILDQVPPQNASTGTREQLQVQIHRLRATQVGECFRQFPQLQVAQDDDRVKTELYP